MLINALSVIIGLFGTIALSWTLSLDVERTGYGNSTLAFLVAVMAVIILRYVYLHLDYKDVRGKWISGIYSLGLAFALTAGKQLHTEENFDIANPMSWIQLFVIAVFFWGPCLYLLQWYSAKGMGINVADGKEDCTGKLQPDEKTKGAKEFLLTWLVIFICWIPVFLAFYPGAFVYDAQDEYVQVATRNFTTHHPLTHVLLLGGAVCFGNKFFDSYNVGIALYTVFQMIVLSGIFAYTVSYLRSKLSRKMCIAVTLFYGLFPVIPMYAVCSSKDTLFNGAFLLALVQMVKLSNALLVKEPEAGMKIGKLCKQNAWDLTVLLLALAAMMLFRNNGFYIILAMIPLLVIAALKLKDRKMGILIFAVTFVAGILLYKGVDTALAVVLQADDSENQELLTVPIQQLGRTYRHSPDVFSPEEKVILFSYLPEADLLVYDADLSDLLKAEFNNARYLENPSEFWDLWFAKLIKKPVTYLNAWFMTSYGYWYPDTVINVYGGQERFTFQYEESSYFGFEAELPGVRDSKFPWLEEQYRKMSLELYQQQVPVISMFFSPGFLFWLFMGCTMYCIYERRYTWLLPFGCMFLLWGTAILGPTFLVRYVLILWFAAPLYLQGYGDKNESIDTIK